MKDQSTPKLDAFRSLVRQAESLHAELTSLDTATSDRDAIKARIGACDDESEARKLLGDLTRAEEAVTLKSIREPRLRADLLALLTESKHAFHAAHGETGRLLAHLPDQAVSRFRDLLANAQPGGAEREVVKLNEHTIETIAPMDMVRRQKDKLNSAWREVELAADNVPARVQGMRAALALLDKVVAAQVEIAAESKRLAAACDAFLKVFSKR
jgi:hypothetical protein